MWEYNEEGKKVHKKVDPPLYFFTKTPDESPIKSIYGENVKKHTFTSYGKFRDAREMYKNANKQLFESDIDVETKYILENWAGKEFKQPDLNVHYLDIEVHSETGFPHPDQANHPITIITTYSTKNKKYTIFAEKDFDPNFKNYKGETVLKDTDDIFIYDKEEDLIQAYIDFVRKSGVDILSGWNIDFYDMPYIINRSNKLLGEEITNKLSPVEHIEQKTQTFKDGKERTFYRISGINIIDYLPLYKKYNPKEQASFKLDYIAKAELKESKLEYEGSLKDLYRKDWQRYVEYNIQDVSLINKLDVKTGFMQLMVDICYSCCVPFENYEKTTKVLDGAFVSKLKLENVVVPDAKVIEGGDQYAGAFVRDPEVGCWDWIISYDATSLYPSIMIEHNISPETKVYKCNEKCTKIIMSCLEGKDSSFESWELNLQATEGEDSVSVKEMAALIKEKGYSIASNGAVYRHDIVGVIPRFLKDWFATRQFHKKQQFECETAGNKDGEKLHAGRQKIMKILLNSCYGYLGSIYSRFYEKDNALAVTATGQEIIKCAMDSVDNYFRTWNETELGKKLKAVSIENTVTYGDTDSLYLNAGRVLDAIGYKEKDNIEKTAKFLDEKICKIFVQVINKNQEHLAKVRMNCKECEISFKREMITRRAMFLAKKRYAAWVIIGENGPIPSGDSHEIEVKGVESVRSSTPQIIRTYLKSFYKELLQKYNETEINKFIKKLYTELQNKPPEEFAKISTANNLEKYILPTGYTITGTPFHIKGCAGYNNLIIRSKTEDKYEQIFEGDKIKSLYVKGSTKFPDYPYQVISFKDKLPTEFGFIIDYETNIFKTFVDPIKSFYEILKWDLPSFTTEDITDLFS